MDELKQGMENAGIDENKNEKSDDMIGTENTSSAENVTVGTPACEEAPVDSSAENSAASTDVPTENVYYAPQYAQYAAPTGTFWTYRDQAESDRIKKRKEGTKGAVVYGMIMTVLFLICFGILLTLLVTGFGKIVPGSQNVVYRDRTVYVREDGEESGALSVPEVAAKVTPSVVGISVTVSDDDGPIGTAVGTGVIYSEDGYIITNYHVIEDASDVTVVFADGKRAHAEIVGGDALSDVAVVKVECTGLTPAEFGDSDDLIVGERAIAIGNPSGLDYAGTVTVGYVSAVDRTMKICDETGYLIKRMHLIQTDASLNPGNSGGPLVNSQGQVIGINTLKLTDTEGLGFSIPINGVLTIADSVIKTGSYSGNAVADTGVSLGIQCIAVVKGKAVSGTNVTAPETGIYVVSVEAGRSAYGYLFEGDVIIAIDGMDVATVNDMRDVLFNHYSGENVILTVYRGGITTEVVIPLK